MNSPTICAISTAQGGAIGIVRVSGSNAIAYTDTIFRGRKSLTEAKAGTVHFGTIYCDDILLDEVLVTIFRSPHSYTGEDSVEIACHGSSYILSNVLILLIDAGCEMAKPGEYTQRAFLNGKMDLSQAEAVADLIASTNAASHRVALNQMRGGISERLASLRKQLLEMTSLLELELDFSEEEVSFADRQQLQRLGNDILAEIRRLSASFAAGNAIKNGIPVAIIGAPNVGKSTLLNQLLHEERAIVSDIQGTTRDLIEDTLTINGFCFRFIDTAGIRHTTEPIEQLGIDRSLQAARSAQIIILMRDISTEYPEVPVRDDQKVIHIVNKIDTALFFDVQEEEILISAREGKGIELLTIALLAAIPPLPDDAIVITNLRHKQALDDAAAAITQALSGLDNNIPSDLVAEDLRLCLNYLAEILGEISSQSVLENIFSHFCIGK